MSENKPGFGDLLKQRSQGAPTQQVGSSSIINGTGITYPPDSLSRRYWLYAELYSIGEAKDREYVKNAISLEELARVIRLVLRDNPWSIALEYVIRYKGDVIGLMRELVQNASLPDWLRTLISLAMGGEDAKT